MTLAIELIAQRLQIAVEQLALLLRQIAAHPRQLLTIVRRELCQIQFVHQRFQARRFRLQTKILRLCQRRIAGLRADAALNFIELATRVALLLRKLVKRVGDIAGAFLLLLGLAAGFEQLTADLQDFLVQRIRGEVGCDLARLIGQIADLRTQRLEKFGEIIDNLLVLARALKGGAAFLERVQCRL